MTDRALGYCGLFCGGCGMYQSTRAGKPVSDESGNPLVCDGCNSSRLTPWCADCAIKNCARKKGYRDCIECPENPCEIMTGFMNDPKYPYHLAVQEDMRFLKKAGIDAFEQKITERYTCPSCGSMFDWFSLQCPTCGKSVK